MAGDGVSAMDGKSTLPSGGRGTGTAAAPLTHAEKKRADGEGPSRQLDSGMPSIQIGSNTDLEALEHNPHHTLTVYLRSLGALETAIPRYQLLRQLVYASGRNWSCPKIGVLEGYCALAFALLRLRNDLLKTVAPAAADVGLQDAAVLQVFMDMKRTAFSLKDTKRVIKGSKGLVLERAAVLGDQLYGTAHHVLIGAAGTLAVFQAGIPGMVNDINELLGTLMVF